MDMCFNKSVTNKVPYSVSRERYLKTMDFEMLQYYSCNFLIQMRRNENSILVIARTAYLCRETVRLGARLVTPCLVRNLAAAEKRKRKLLRVYVWIKGSGEWAQFVPFLLTNLFWSLPNVMMCIIRVTSFVISQRKLLGVASSSVVDSWITRCDAAQLLVAMAAAAEQVTVCMLHETGAMQMFRPTRLQLLACN
jgi:hypothetical protein